MVWCCENWCFTQCFLEAVKSSLVPLSPGYRKFIPRYSEKTVCLSDLTKKTEPDKLVSRRPKEALKLFLSLGSWHSCNCCNFSLLGFKLSSSYHMPQELNRWQHHRYMQIDSLGLGKDYPFLFEMLPGHL